MPSGNAPHTAANVHRQATQGGGQTLDASRHRVQLPQPLGRDVCLAGTSLSTSTAARPAVGPNTHEKPLQMGHVHRT